MGLNPTYDSFFSRFSEKVLGRIELFALLPRRVSHTDHTEILGHVLTLSPKR